ncbi:Uncharacterised protein [Delftia tsuruhatensis]|nr:Uncharacterised protein [Delftia tsuruhatensis]CAC9685334.1 Uncharacterised protein [Delftia tsuruhatensis]
MNGRNSSAAQAPSSNQPQPGSADWLTRIAALDSVEAPCIRQHSRARTKWHAAVTIAATVILITLLATSLAVAAQLLWAA